jgi:hypothetical protein
MDWPIRVTVDYGPLKNPNAVAVRLYRVTATQTDTVSLPSVSTNLDKPAISK